MDKLAIIEQIRQSNDLLSLPQALSEILREVDNPKFNSESLAHIILKDPALTGRILKLANSSFYHRFSDISTVHQAVQMLGITTVKCMALSSSVFRPESIQALSGIDAKGLFANILTTAAAAERIAKQVKYQAPEEAFIAGLLQDIGIIYFLHHHPKEYRKIVDGQVSCRTLVEAERQLFGIDHCEVGYHLTTKWRLPAYISDAVREHHHTESPQRDLVLPNCIHLAVLLAPDTITTYPTELESRLGRINAVAEALGLSKAEVDGISTSLFGWGREVADYLGIDIGDSEAMLTRANRELWKTYITVENLFKERQELSRRLLDEEREKGAMEAKNIAMATLSHYLNNAAMAIYGRSQILRMTAQKGDKQALEERLEPSLDVIDKSVQKIVAVLQEMKEITPIANVKFLDASQAMNMDDRIATRLIKLERESGLVLPVDAENEVHPVTR